MRLSTLCHPLVEVWQCSNTACERKVHQVVQKQLLGEVAPFWLFTMSLIFVPKFIEVGSYMWKL